jgi:hypothetical protein
MSNYKRVLRSLKLMDKSELNILLCSMYLMKEECEREYKERNIKFIKIIKAINNKMRIRDDTSSDDSDDSIKKADIKLLDNSSDDEPIKKADFRLLDISSEEK